MSALEASSADDVLNVDAAISPPRPAPVAATAVPASKASRLPLIAMSVATLASVLSVTGLLVASRTIARATAAIEALEARGDMPASRDHAPAVTSSQPAEITQAIDRLRVDLARRPAASPSDGAAIELVRDGQGELADRISAVSAQVERLERTLSASRKAHP